MKKLLLLISIVFLSHISKSQKVIIGQTHKEINVLHYKDKTKNESDKLSVILPAGTMFYYFDKKQICYEQIFIVNDTDIADKLSEAYNSLFKKVDTNLWFFTRQEGGITYEVVIQKKLNVFTYQDYKTVSKP